MMNGNEYVVNNGGVSFTYSIIYFRSEIIFNPGGLWRQANVCPAIRLFAFSFLENMPHTNPLVWSRWAFWVSSDLWPTF